MILVSIIGSFETAFLLRMANGKNWKDKTADNIGIRGESIKYRIQPLIRPMRSTKALIFIRQQQPQLTCDVKSFFVIINLIFVGKKQQKMKRKPLIDDAFSFICIRCNQRKNERVWHPISISISFCRNYFSFLFD